MFSWMTTCYGEQETPIHPPRLRVDLELTQSHPASSHAGTKKGFATWLGILLGLGAGGRGSVTERVVEGGK